MPNISLSQARALCTASEYALVKASTRTEVVKLSPSRLKAKIARARKLRNKWRDQHRTQRRRVQSQRGKREAPEDTRSRKKRKLFDQVIERFETQLARASVPKKKATTKRKPKVRAPRGLKADRPDRRLQRKAKSAAKRAGFKAAGRDRKRGHSSGRSRRAQARRDGR